MEQRKSMCQKTWKRNARKPRKLKKMKKDVDQCGKWLGFGPTMIKELESGKI
jgi:hypothetical protein